MAPDRAAAGLSPTCRSDFGADSRHGQPSDAGDDLVLVGLCGVAYADLPAAALDADAVGETEDLVKRVVDDEDGEVAGLTSGAPSTTGRAGVVLRG